MQLPILGFIALLPFTALAQPGFDAASVKVSPPADGQNRVAGTRIDSGRVRYSNLPLAALLIAAFGVNVDRIAGIPGEFHYPLAFTIEATYPTNTPKEQIPLMLQMLLAERFRLKFHHETRPTPVYALVVAKNGPKIKLSTSQAQSVGNFRPGTLEVKKIALGQIANLMHNSGWVDRTIVDQTNLTGEYDLSLEWTPDSVKLEDSGAPSIFTAVQEQWGLKLEPQTVPLDILVLDHVERPSEN